jgi:hypothetical protein
MNKLFPLKPIILLFMIYCMILSSCKKDEEPADFTVSTGEITELNGTCAVASGMLRLNSGTVEQYGHCWSIYLHPTYENDSKTRFGSTSSAQEFFSDITGLSIGTVYYVRSYVLDNGVVNYGNEVPFVTPTLNVGSVDVSNQGVDYFDASATITIYEGAAATYGFCWANHEKPTIYDSKTESLLLTSTETVTKEFTNLHSERTYYLRAYANNGGLVAYGPVAIVEFEQVMFLSAGVELASNSGIKLKANLDFKGVNIVDHGFCWSLGQNPQTSDENIALGAMVSPGEFSANLSEFPDETIYIKGYASTGDDVFYSDEYQFRKFDPYNVAIFPHPMIERPEAFYIDDELYVGFGMKNNYYYNDVYQFNETLNSWNEVASCPGNIYYSTAYTVSSHGYSLKLRNGNEILGWKYVPAQDEWVSITGMVLNYEADDINCAVLNGRTFLAVGDYSERMLHMYELNENTQEWVERSGREYKSTSEIFIFNISGKAYFWCDYNAYSWAYDAETDTWVQLEFQPLYWGYYSMPNCFAFNGKGYLFAEKSVFEYSPATDNWVEKSELGQVTNNGLGVMINQNIYIGLGSNNYNGYNPTLYPYLP